MLAKVTWAAPCEEAVNLLPSASRNTARSPGATPERTAAALEAGAAGAALGVGAAGLAGSTSSPSILLLSDGRTAGRPEALGAGAAAPAGAHGEAALRLSTCHW